METRRSSSRPSTSPRLASSPSSSASMARSRPSVSCSSRLMSLRLVSCATAAASPSAEPVSGEGQGGHKGLVLRTRLQQG